MPTRECKSHVFCGGFTTTDDEWCPSCRVSLQKVFYELHPKRKPKADQTAKGGWTSQTVMPAKASRGKIGPAYRQAILNALTDGSKSGRELAAAVGVQNDNRTYLRARTALIKDGEVERKGKSYSLADEKSAAA
jgi:hypothetical protein